MKVLSAQQIREADNITMQQEQITSDMLMERAARVCSNWILQQITDMEPVHIFCGTGNNGGDGLCIARHLHLEGIFSRVFLVGDTEKASADFILNWKRLQKLGYAEIYVFADTDPGDAADCICIIDAIFGTGLSRPPENVYADAIACINNSQALRVAIDLPSGMLSDDPVPGACVEADITLTFQSPRLACFFPENEKYTGNWHVLNIGLAESAIASAKTAYHYVQVEDIYDFLLVRKTFSHKGNYGHSLIVGGNADMEGAAILAGTACLRMGSGLVSVASPGGTMEHPELMHAQADDLFNKLSEKKWNALGVGPGLGTSTEAKEMLLHILQTAEVPLVLDADALNILAAEPALMAKLPKNSILTPHPKEFERLFGTAKNWKAFLELLIQKAAEHSCYILYKRAFTIIANPQGAIYFNSTGNPGMATAGSGDVLTGMICGLLAQGYTPEQAAIAGVFLHGLAGDIALEDLKGENLIAGDIVRTIPRAAAIFIH